VYLRGPTSNGRAGEEGKKGRERKPGREEEGEVREGKGGKGKDSPQIFWPRTVPGSNVGKQRRGGKWDR